MRRSAGAFCKASAVAAKTVQLCASFITKYGTRQQLRQDSQPRAGERLNALLLVDVAK